MGDDETQTFLAYIQSQHAEREQVFARIAQEIFAPASWSEDDQFTIMMRLICSRRAMKVDTFGSTASRNTPPTPKLPMDPWHGPKEVDACPRDESVVIRGTRHVNLRRMPSLITKIWNSHKTPQVMSPSRRFHNETSQPHKQSHYNNFIPSTMTPISNNPINYKAALNRAKGLRDLRTLIDSSALDRKCRYVIRPHISPKVPTLNAVQLCTKESKTMIAADTRSEEVLDESNNSVKKNVKAKVKLSVELLGVRVINKDIDDYFKLKLEKDNRR